ncbi:uncharacterized protein M437DRAFT_67006 [Aureobasidium melanogenum CBS 110374]|uniref:Uncharacterized protein n=1 Tax=Aureobasidium melanogenum (strain CBS 110374) TaxID=1043003 RepID=A0A074VQS7_AURM1|nr:uncharacterized protein M437DRAFT_67006 [Aureobasidium melanogenum CBS 110374]KEQ61539.1 hypothetical protein M437DRAFT_67006 [Aureobasidium melanogenum CBS 110374]
MLERGVIKSFQHVYISVSARENLGTLTSASQSHAEQTERSNHDRDRVQLVLRECPATVCPTERWMEDLDQGCPSAFAAFLLVYLERLENVEIGAEFSRLFSYIGESTMRQLTRLTTASIGTFRDEVYIGPGRVPLDHSAGLHHPLLFFNLPNVHHLSLNVPKPPENMCFRWPFEGLIPLTTNLESLEVALTFLNERKLAHILKGCPKLLRPEKRDVLIFHSNRHYRPSNRLLKPYTCIWENSTGLRDPGTTIGAT